MRVLTVRLGGFRGGAGRRYVEALDGLARRHHEVELLSSTPPPRDVACRLQYRPLPATRQTASVLGSLRHKHRVRTAVRRFQPDLILAFGLRDALLALRGSKGFGVPVLLCVRALELVLNNNPTLVRAPQVRPLQLLLSRLYSFLFTALARYVHRQCALIVFQSPEQLRLNIEHRMISARHSHRVSFLTNNCNPSWMRNQPPYRPIASHQTCVIGHLTWNKGFPLLFDALIEVLQKVPSASLAVVGSGPFAQEIERHARSQSLPVDFRGHLGDPWAALRESRALIFPSTHFEAAPNVLLEAIELGAPILASMLAATPLGPDHPGLFSPDSAQSLAASWIRVLTDDTFYAALCSASTSLRRTYRFDWIAALEEQCRHVIHH